jgi:hypothetical protein
MKYPSGDEVRIGDRLRIGPSLLGTIVCSIDSGEYSPDYPKEQWAYLGRGVIVLTETAGLIHYKELDHDMQLVARGDATP